MQMTTDPVLVTGSSGVVGASMTEAFGPERTIGLCREPLLATDVRGDVTLPRMGLDAHEYDRLAGRIGAVVHGAAVTSFRRPPDDIRRTNVQGTVEATRLARSAGVPLHLISTVYVHASAVDGAGAGGRAEVYRASKRDAEEIVRTAGVPWSISRLTLLVGHSTTGAIVRHQGIFAAMKAIVAGSAPLVPVAPGSVVDFLPCDYAAIAVRQVVEHGLTGEFWVTAGPRAMTIERFVDRCAACASELGWEIERPRLVDPEMVHRLILPAFGPEIGRDLRTRLELFVDILSPLATDGSLPHDNARIPGLGPPPDPTACLDVTLRSWARRTQVRRAPAGAAS